MGKKDNSVKLNKSNGQITIVVNEDISKRIQALFETRHYETQTLEDICETVVRQGTKTLEKRRKDSKDSAVERAKETLRKAGITTVEAEEEPEVGAGDEEPTEGEDEAETVEAE